VCPSVCPAIRFHSSKRIFSKFGGNLLRVMTRSVGYIFCVCTQCMRVLAKIAHMWTFTYFFTDSLKICWEHTTIVAWTTLRYYTTIVSCSRTARVIKRSFIHGRILFTFAENILQITISSMGYVRFMFTHRAHACERARARS
jgi:hypothetical protein